MIDEAITCFDHPVADNGKTNPVSLKRKDIAEIEASSLFDAKWFANNYPDLVKPGQNPAEIYLRHGVERQLSASPMFDGAAYLEINKDVAAAGMNPLLHYERYGRAEGRQILPRTDIETEEERPLPRMKGGGGKTSSLSLMKNGSKFDNKKQNVHYGFPIFQLIESARNRFRNRKNLENYHVVMENFDKLFYILRYRDIAVARNLDLVQHYMAAGSREGRSPHQFFSPHLYLERYEDIKEAGVDPFWHWISTGRAEGRIGAPFRNFEYAAKMLGMTPGEVQEKLIALADDLKHRLSYGTLGQMVVNAAKDEPLIENTWLEMAMIKIPPFQSDEMLGRMVALHRLQAAAGFKRARFVVLTNRPRWGGGRRMEGYIAHALARIGSPEEIVVLTTEEGGAMPPNKLPDGVRYVEFSEHTKRFKDDARQRLLVEYLRSLQPEAVFNINSRLFWETMQPYGKALAAATKLIAGLFCNERSLYGFTVGYPVRFFYRTADNLHAICPDSHALATELAERHMLPDDWRKRLYVLEAPVDPSIPVAELPTQHEGRRPQVFWAGRFDPQKRVDLVYAVAEKLPHIDFRMWGEALAGAMSERLPPKPANVKHEGVYAAFADLPLQEADAWFYTSEWDGVPSVLLEVAMTGVPLVGSLAGGTGEVLREGFCEAVEDIEDIDRYCEGIQRIISDPDAARARALKLRETLVAERTEDRYVEMIRSLLEDLPARQPDLVSPPAVLPPAVRRSDPPDLTLILTAHDETAVSGPTMKAADRAVAAAQAAGFSVERIIALDNPAPRTREYFGQPAFDHWQRVELEYGDVGHVRNEMVQRAQGDNIAFLDADDLFSDNWLAEGLAAMQSARREGRRVIVHPELNWKFDGERSIFYNTAQNHPFFSPWFLAMMHLYDTLCIAPREAHEQLPYGSRDIPNGLSREDWQFTVETMAGGWEHISVPDTIIFKRRRDNSLVTESASRKAIMRALDCMAIDRIANLGKAAADGRTAATTAQPAIANRDYEQVLEPPAKAPERRPDTPAGRGVVASISRWLRKTTESR